MIPRFYKYVVQPPLPPPIPTLHDEAFGYKTKHTTESAKPCGYFRCLPSDRDTTYTLAYKSRVGGTLS